MTGCESYSLPDYIREHVDLVKPTVHFVHRIPGDPALRKRSPSIKLGDPSSFNGPKTNGDKVTELLSLDNCDKFTTPACLRALYSIDYKPVVPECNSYGIGVSSSVRLSHLLLTPRPVEFTPQAYIGSDLDLFFASVVPSSSHSQFRPNCHHSNFSQHQQQKRPELVSIDGGGCLQGIFGFRCEPILECRRCPGAGQVICV